jgi:hypothetical protein
MFIEVVTRRNETVFLNVEHILFLTQHKNGAVIFDASGNDYYLDEPYTSVCERISLLLKGSPMEK